MSEDASTSDTATAAAAASSESISKTQYAIRALFSITTIPPSILSTPDPALALLHDPAVSSQISSILRHPDSGAGDNSLCRWFYDTFQSSVPNLQLLVLRYLPTIAGLYLSRVSLRKPLAGFEAILLALYAHETTARGGQAVTVSIPDLSHPSIYHETKEPVKNNDSTELNLAIVSPTLEPHGTVRSTRRARIVGVALELYYSKISLMPVESKLEFCGFCEAWSEVGGAGRIPLPWELLQPVLRILGHCLLGPKREKELVEAASGACRSLNRRALHDIDAKAVLATRSLLSLSNMPFDPTNDFDHTEILMTNVISL